MNTCVLLVPHFVLSRSGLSPDSLDQQAPIKALATKIRNGWRDDDLSKFRFVAIELEESWMRESDQHIVLMVPKMNLGLDYSDPFERGRDYDSGIVDALFGERFLFIVVRNSTLGHVEWTTNRERLETLWEERKKMRRDKLQEESDRIHKQEEDRKRYEIERVEQEKAMLADAERQGRNGCIWTAVIAVVVIALYFLSR